MTPFLSSSDPLAPVTISVSAQEGQIHLWDTPWVVLPIVLVRATTPC